MAATWLPRTNELQDLSHFNSFCRAGAGLFTALNSLFWCERVTLSVGFASLSSQEQNKQNQNMCFEISADGHLGGMKRKVRCVSQLHVRNRGSFYFRY